MKSQEQINKIEAVVLYILQHFKEGLDYIKLFKIMYFAQREYLATYGLTIAEDTFKARQLGPVPSLTYKVVKMAENGDESADLKRLHFFYSSGREPKCLCHGGTRYGLYSRYGKRGIGQDDSQVRQR